MGRRRLAPPGVRPTDREGSEGAAGTDFELLAIDDGSTDETPAYLKTLTDPRVCYHRLDKVGVVGNRERALAEQRAGTVHRMQADGERLGERRLRG